MNFEKLEPHRITYGKFGSKKFSDYGLFNIPYKSYMLTVIAAPKSTDWQHVSVSLPNRCPNWQEMCFVKDLFWNEGETVVQFHPKKSEYKNLHPHCLHLWKMRAFEYELPPNIYV